MAYHAGVLRALEQVGGITPDAADLVIGTSAGSVVGAYMRSGWTPEDMWNLAMGSHPSYDGLSVEEIDERNRSILAPAFSHPVDLIRRGVGSAYVATRSFVRVPPAALRALPRVPSFLTRAFPGGLFAMEEGRRRFAEELPVSWPDKALWLCAFDIERGRRVVLGRPGRAPLASLQKAVLASCAIPGVYPPVRIGRLTLADGGVYSTTNLDLAAKHGCDVIIGIAPMAYDTAGPLPAALNQLVRRVPARMLVNEMVEARNRGSEVLLLRPSAGELRIHGPNLMRRHGWDVVARAAYEHTARTLETDRFRAVLGEVAA